ncbi:MAG: DUF192 domain-containing protein [Acidobacteriaceae bacterium]
MENRTYCVYNRTRECFLSLGVSVADTSFARIKGLIGRLKLGFDEGLWVVPSSGVHTWGVLFPLDLIYLDEKHRVVYVTEHFPRFRIASLKTAAASVLELPTHTIYSSHTEPGDELVICLAEEMEERLKAEGATSVEDRLEEPVFSASAGHDDLTSAMTSGLSASGTPAE